MHVVRLSVFIEIDSEDRGEASAHAHQFAENIDDIVLLGLAARRMRGDENPKITHLSAEVEDITHENPLDDVIIKGVHKPESTLTQGPEGCTKVVHDHPDASTN